jgi:hypothetical protein
VLVLFAAAAGTGFVAPDLGLLARKRLYRRSQAPHRRRRGRAPGGVRCHRRRLGVLKRKLGFFRSLATLLLDQRGLVRLLDLRRG